MSIRHYVSPFVLQYLLYWKLDTLQPKILTKNVSEAV